MARKRKEALVKVEEIDVSKVNLDAIKEELTDYIDERIKDEFNNEIEKANKKLIHEKNIKIIWRNIVIIGLMGIIGLLLLLLYRTGYFNRFLNGKIIPKNDIVQNDKNKEDTLKKTSLDELKEEYGYLIDNIVINEKSKYLKDFYNGNLSIELKKYLALNSLNFNNLDKEDDYNILSKKELERAYYKIFKDDIEDGSFDYNGNKVRYINSLNSYLTEKILVKEKNNILRVITNIEIVNNLVNISTCEALLKDDIIYNLLTEEEIGKYNGSIINYKDNLNMLVYTFKDDKLIGLKKID